VRVRQTRRNVLGRHHFAYISTALSASEVLCLPPLAIAPTRASVLSGRSKVSRSSCQSDIRSSSFGGFRFGEVSDVTASKPIVFHIIEAAVPPVFDPCHCRVLSRLCTSIYYLELVVVKLRYLRIASAVVVRRGYLSETRSGPQDSQSPLSTTPRE